MKIVRCGVDSSDPLIKLKSIDDHSSLKIGTLGRLVEKKGIHTLIGAAQILKNSAIDFLIEIAGDGPLREQLEDQVRENDLEDKVHFLGALPNTKVNEWMKTLNIFALPCQKDVNGDMDGIPVVLMEAMNLGVPVLSTNISGIPELVQHNKTGLMSEQKDSNALALNIKKLFFDRQLHIDLVKNAKQRIRNEFDRTFNARRLIEIFND